MFLIITYMPKANSAPIRIQLAVYQFIVGRSKKMFLKQTNLIYKILHLSCARYPLGTHFLNSFQLKLSNHAAIRT